MATYSRVLAAEMYGEHRPYGYVFGGSGGAYKTMACIENTPGVWDGAVPFIHGTPMSLPNLFTVQAHAMRVLRDKFPSIVDAIEPGGSGDMYAGLEPEEREALAEVDAHGLPAARVVRRRTDRARVHRGVLGLVDNMVQLGPRVLRRLLVGPGLSRREPARLARAARIQHKTSVTAGRHGVRGAGARPSDVHVGDVRRQQRRRAGRVPAREPAGGRAAGARRSRSRAADASGHVVHIPGVVGDYVTTGIGEAHLDALKAIKAGDDVLVDNAIYLATQTYHRHQVPDPEFAVWDQFRVGW